MSDGIIAIARGRIKVDARKALDKLRDHMLVDPHLWACEIARVAIALGATQLDVEWGADDLTLDFDGRALAPDAIAHARDHVLTPLAGIEGDALRALGIGVGAALSLDPAYVEVRSGASSVRFERTYIDEEDVAPAPAAAPPSRLTTRVRFRRRLGFQSLTRSIWTETPAEVLLLEPALERSDITLRLNGKPVARRSLPVLTVDLDVPGTTRAVLEVLRHPVEPQIEFCTYGVRLSSYAIRGCWGLAEGVARLLPLRVVVDAPSLPTNASRSQVRTDSELAERVFSRIEPAFTIAVQALTGTTAPMAARIGHAVTVHADAEALADVLGGIAAEAARATRAGVELKIEAKALLRLPVLHDCFGGRLAFADLRGGTKDAPLRVYEGEAMLDPTLAPWLGGVVWRRGSAAERALEGLETISVKDLIGPAVAAQQRRARALTHSPSATVVATSSATEWKESFRVESGSFAGLEGEIAFGPANPGRVVSARIFVDERALETVPLPGVRLPIDLALGWPNHIVPRFEYDAVERNEALSCAVHYALKVAALALGTRSEDTALVRRAMTVWSESTTALGESPTLGPLAEKAIWKTNTGDMVTFVAIAAYVRTTGAICCATSSTLSAPDGRIILAASEVPSLRSLLPKTTAFIPYDRARIGMPAIPEPSPSVAVAIHQGAIDGWVTPSSEARSSLRVYHAGIQVRTETWQPRNGAVEIVLADHAGVPNEAFNGLVWSSPIPPTDNEEDALVEVVTEACERNAIELGLVARYLDASGKRFTERGQDNPLVARIEALPARRERLRLDRLKAEVMARAPIDLDRLLGSRLRGTVVRQKRGAVTVALTGDNTTHVFFAGHLLSSHRNGVVPVEAWIDVVAEDFVEEWNDLSPDGVRWAEGTVIDAALTLLEKLTEVDGFADDKPALELMLSLLVESPARAGFVLQRTRWPTVQGQTMKLGDEARVNVGTNRYEMWRGAKGTSPYDAPAVHLPKTAIGELRARIFASAAVAITNVTDPTARLQALRAKGRRGAPPRLDGAPGDPRLRASLAELGATLVEGELELIDGSQSSIAFVDVDGVGEKVVVEIGCPIRAVYRAEANDGQMAERELAPAAKMLLLRLVGELDDLPCFVRIRLRSLVCAGLSRTGKASAADKALAVFESIDRRWHALEALTDPISYTTDPPPYPPDVSVVLQLTPSEATALSKENVLIDVTMTLRARRRGIEARASAPLTEIVVSPAVRTECMFFIPVDEEGIRGEIGLLHPRHAAGRRIELFTTMRPLVHIADPEGWPIVAALNDDQLVPDEGFSGLEEAKKDTTRIHQLVRRILGASLGALLPAPGGVLGVVRLPSPFLVRTVKGPARTVAAMGVFWLPKEWPERPSIHVEATNVMDPDRLPVIASGATPSVVVPVCGRVWITADAKGLERALEHVMAWVSLRLAAHVRAHANVDRYRWDLSLLDVLDEPATDPLKELAHDRPDPDLMHVVARRAPHLIDKATGDAPEVRTAAVAPTHLQIGTEVEAASDVAEPPGWFFAGLVRRVTELVSRAPEPYVESPLTAAVAHALEGMALTGAPVLGVRSTKRGRPVSYNRTTRHVLVNETHALVVGHAKKPNGVLFVVLAALSEINRELVEVTDAEEVAKVLDLLRANG